MYIYFEGEPVSFEGDSSEVQEENSTVSEENSTENENIALVLDKIDDVNENVVLLNNTLNNFLGLYLIVFVIAQISSWRRSL